MTAVQLIVGLGNPGPEYDQTRHNAGALFVERIAHAQNVNLVADRKYFGLTGRYSMELDYLFAAGPPAAAPEFGAPSLATAVREQWGLRLVSGKGPLETVVIESAQLPTPN